MLHSEKTVKTGFQRTITVLLWLSIVLAWLISIFSVIEEMCLATACRDTVNFTFLGINLGWLGVAYFSVLLIMLWQRTRKIFLNWVLVAMVFAGVGAELRLLWIQKYVIKGWCPLCVSICFALFCAAILLLFERNQVVESDRISNKSVFTWIIFILIMIASGLLFAILGVKSLE